MGHPGINEIFRVARRPPLQEVVPVKKLHIVPVLLVLFCLLVACGGPVEPVTTAETTAQPAIVTTTEAATETEPEATQQSVDDLLDFALIDRMFAMTLADFFREEGDAIDPVDWFEAGPYYSFSKYDPESYFFFDGDDPETDKLNAMAAETPDLLVGKYSLTLGELKQWLSLKNINYDIREQTEEERFCCIFTVGRHTLTAYTDNDSAYDDAIVRRMFVKPRG